MDIKHIFDVPAGSIDISPWLSSIKDHFYSDDMSADSELSTPDFNSGMLTLPVPVVNPYYYRSYPTIAQALAVGSYGSFADLARCRACIYEKGEFDPAELNAENSQYKEENPHYKTRGYHLPNTVDGDLAFRYSYPKPIDISRYAAGGVMKLFRDRDPFGSMERLHREIDTDLFPEASERLCAIESLIADGFDISSLTVSEIPVPARLVRKLAANAREFTKDHLAELYVKLYARISRFEKILNMKNVPALIIVNETRMLIEVIEKIYLELSKELSDEAGAVLASAKDITPLPCELIPKLYEKRYEGDEPFIYLCFSSDDSEDAIRIIDSLTDSGYRVYFHDETESSDEQIERTAERISSAEKIILILSDASVSSFACRSEINYSISVGKMPVVLKSRDITLPAGLEMQLGVSKEINISDSEDKLLTTLNTDPEWQNVRNTR